MMAYTTYKCCADFFFEHFAIFFKILNKNMTKLWVIQNYTTMNH